MLYEWFHDISPRSQPLMTRQSYRHELVNVLTFPIALSLVEGGVMGVLSRKVFDVPQMLFATIVAAPMFANLTSFAWARLARGRRKVRFITGLQAALLLGVAAIAVLPVEWPGPLLLAMLVIATRCLQAGIVTMRSIVWRMNYPELFRAQITSRLTVVNSIIMAVAPLVGYAILDSNPDAFRIVYPASIVVAMFGVIAFSRVRLRHEKDLLRYEDSPAVAPQPYGETGPVYEYDTPLDVSRGRHSPWAVLRHDHLFRRYLIWQFVGGMATMMGETIIIYLIAELTSEVAGEWRQAGLEFPEYFVSILLTTAIPLVLATLTMPMWATYLDRVHIVPYRAKQAILWIINQASNWLSAITHSLTIIGVARLLQGITRGGGMLAWHLGHNDFADRRMVPTYMGIHVTLTGLRGLIAPFLAMMLFAGKLDFGAVVIEIPGFHGLGYHVFLVTTALAIVSEIGFSTLRKHVPTERSS